VSELQYIKQDIANRKKIIAQKQREIEETLERIIQALKPKQQKKEELSNGEDNLSENLPFCISEWIRRHKIHELAKDEQNTSKDVLEKHLNEAVRYICSCK
jgi:hypothetical protein